MTEEPLVERLKERSLTKSRSAFECANCGFEANLIEEIVDALEASISEPARAEEGKEPVAWVFELATHVDAQTYEPTRWNPPQLSFTPPCAGKHQRNVRPLYAAPSSSTLEITEEAVEAGVDAAESHLEIDWDGEGPFIRSDSIDSGVRAALEASLPFLSQTGGWRDISTAPKDGTVIWACDAAQGYDSKVLFLNGEWECVNYNQMGMSIGFYPTHWRPLDRLPAPSNEAGE